MDTGTVTGNINQTTMTNELRVQAENWQAIPTGSIRSEEHTSELQSQSNLVCRLLLEKKKKKESRAAIGMGFTRLRGDYVPGPRNRVVADVYPQLGFAPREASESSWAYDLADGPLTRPGTLLCATLSEPECVSSRSRSTPPPCMAVSWFRLYKPCARSSSTFLVRCWTTRRFLCFLFFLKDPAPPGIPPLSQPAALPI